MPTFPLSPPAFQAQETKPQAQAGASWKAGWKRPAEHCWLFCGLPGHPLEHGLLCKHSKLGQLCVVWPWLQPTQLTKQITKYIFSLFFLNEIFSGCIIYRIPANCSLAFFPRKENISSDFPHTRPHPAGCMPRLPSRAGAGLLLWRKAGMCHCPGAAWAAVSGVDAALRQGGIHPGVGGWKSVSGGGVGRNCADSGAAGSCPGTSRHRNRASMFTKHPLILSESPNNYARWVGHISLLFPCN